jgi:hypothetical protein
VNEVKSKVTLSLSHRLTSINKEMQKKILWFALTLVIASTLQVNAQYAKQDSTYKRYFVGSSLFIIANLIPDNNPPDYGQLNFGYRITGKDVISFELRTWKYGWPIGIPYGKSFEAEGKGFPGYIRDSGFAFAYQRFLWKGLFAEINVTNFFQSFVDKTGKKIDTGFQIFNSYRVGYHIKLFKDRFFIQPSIAITHRPYHTEMPVDFKQVDDKWSKFFFGEPNLQFGFNF